MTAPTPPNRLAFWTPFVVDYNGHRFGKYSPGWSLLLSIGYALNVPWFINALLGAAILWLVAHLGKLLYGPKVGLLASLIALATPVFWVMSASLLSHNASLFWICLFLWGYFRLLETGRKSMGLLAGISIGLAFLTRPFAAIGVGGPLLLYLSWLWFKSISSRRGKPLIDTPTLFWLAIPAGTICLLLPLYWRIIGGEWGFNAYTLIWPYDRPGFGPQAGLLGYGLTEISNNFIANLWMLAANSFGWGFYLNLAFIPLPFLLQKPTRREWLLLSATLGLAVAYLFYWQQGGFDAGFPRYYYDALPALWLLTASGIVLLSRRLNRWAAQHYPRWQTVARQGPYWLIALLAIAGLGYFLVMTLPAYHTKYNITAQPIRVVAEAGLENALVFVSPYTSWTDFAAPFAANSPTLDGPIVFAIDSGQSENMAVARQFPERECWVLIDDFLYRCDTY